MDAITRTLERREQMTREEAIKDLERLRTVADSWGDTDAIALDMAIEALEAQTKWIPVSERSPSEDGSYLVTSLLGSVYTAHYYLKHGIGNWQFDRHKSIVAWMPLPEPYREDGE